LPPRARAVVYSAAASDDEQTFHIFDSRGAGHVMNLIRSVPRSCFAMVVMLSAAPAATDAAVKYTLVNLGANGGDRSVAYALNDSSQVVGYYRESLPSPTTPFVWSNGTMTSLNLGSGVAYGINNAGQIAATANNGIAERAFRYANGVGQDLGSLGGQFTFSRGWGINAHGDVTGETATAGATHAFRYSNGVMTDLGSLAGPGFPSVGKAINDSGQVAGTSSITATEQRAFKTVGNTMVNLGTFPGLPASSSHSQALAINNLGHVAGESSHPSGGRAFLHNGTQMINLGTLTGYAHSRATGMNDLGDVVGVAHNNELGLAPFVYSGGVMQNLRDLVAPDPNFELLDALDINNAGQIVGYGQFDPDGAAGPLAPQFRGYLLNPIPEPAGAAIVALAAGVAALSRRQRRPLLR
jgi:probable HAF family extracellular repeat protein